MRRLVDVDGCAGFLKRGDTKFENRGDLDVTERKQEGKGRQGCSRSMYLEQIR